MSNYFGTGLCIIMYCFAVCHYFSWLLFLLVKFLMTICIIDPAYLFWQLMSFTLALMTSSPSNIMYTTILSTEER